MRFQLNHFMSTEPPSTSSLLAAMRRITAQGHYGMSIQDLCAATGQSRMSVSKQLFRLETDHKAFADGRGGAQRYYLFSDAREPLLDESERSSTSASAPTARGPETR
jgi:hypothetical protein